ncbi:(Fe-S)-binding protein [Lacihabitans sp. LS3-19]|uniref:(Fe-S)-binding protein n=1 Tax=Lacihabitans sp. LS3-19 TaxID=2487335 RepID=UPI0020CF6E25|nr:(Fe-S)-binding protein [Lacihabitans sp. LS3-19]MCP9766561.1 (Fe-S)-binding protein [Lacihabitans sp. LS3-19]
MHYIPQVLFLIALATAGYFIARRIILIKKTIQLGKAEDRTDNPSIRLKNMLLLAFGQKKMFARPIVAVLHLAIYLGFIIINLEVLEIVLDGLLGTHRIFLKPLGSLYPILINFFEILALGVIVACVVFLIRRNITKVERLQGSRHSEMKGWPVKDGNIILVFEIILMAAFLKMNAADSVLQGRNVGHFAESQTGSFIISQFLVPAMDAFPSSFLIFVERASWWFHIIGIMCFALYVTYSKHLHIALAFPNTYFSDLNPKGKMSNMPTVSQEVKIMLGLEQAPETPAEVGRFGAKDVEDLTWKNLMDAYSCTECGRCTSACPANITGKALSPRKIMMSTRDRLEDIQKGWLNNGYEYKDEKSLLGDYITDEEILACTSCNACVQECPVMISPLDIILQLRRYRVMEESQAPQSWNMMFQNLETNMAPWKFSPDQRFDWAKED